MSVIDASASGQFRIGDINIHRLGYGAMRLTGAGIWGPPSDRKAALATLRRLPEVGVNFIDTADSYGPDVSEQLIREALHPYEGMLIATKAGLTRPGPDQWVPNGHAAHLIAQAKGSLRKLGVKQIALWQLHRIDPARASRRTVRRRAPIAGRRHHPPRGTERSLGNRHRGRSQDLSGGDSYRTATTWSTAAARTCWPIVPPTVSGSFRGFRLRPAS